MKAPTAASFLNAIVPASLCFAVVLFAAQPGQAQVELQGQPELAAVSSPALPTYSAAASPFAAAAGFTASGSQPVSSNRPFSAFALGVSMGTQGAGVEVAVPLSRSLNLRSGAEFFRYNTTGLQDGITYTANLALQSEEMSVDWFPFHGAFRISPGVMLNNATTVNANLVIPGNQSFTVNDVNYYSSTASPLTGSVGVSFPRAGPRITFGWGNMVPRKKSKHFSMPTEFGMAYFGTGTTLMNFSGSVCQSPNSPSTCQPVSTNPSFQTNVTAEQAKIQKDLVYARFYPILKVGISFKF